MCLNSVLNYNKLITLYISNRGLFNRSSYETDWDGKQVSDLLTISLPLWDGQGDPPKIA